jgi:hypothetical protein
MKEHLLQIDGTEPGKWPRAIVRERVGAAIQSHINGAAWKRMEKKAERETGQWQEFVEEFYPE